MLGSDGKVGGISGCNGYSANYRMKSDTVIVYPPMNGTLIACAPAIMQQEQTFLAMVETAASFMVTPEGWLLVKSANGATIRLTRK